MSETIVDGTRKGRLVPAPERAQARQGGKADGLIALRRLGAEVPAFFVLDAHWLRTCLSARGALDLTLSEHEQLVGLDPTQDAAGCAALRERIRARIAALPLPTELRAEIRAGLTELGVGPWAVRSSMVGEDSASHSFAGQLESFLFRRTAEEVEAAVRAAWASAWSERLTAYRKRAGQADLPAVGVIVQRMVEGEVSGVCFTADTNTGRRDRVLLSATWGLCEGVVSGTCNTDELLVDREGNEISAHIGDKDVEVVRDTEGLGTRERSVPESRRREPCLTWAQVVRITRECCRIADALGRPQDIEWTLAGDTVVILQSRPITTLKEAQNEDGPRVVFDNSNIQESYCGVTTPLTFSFASNAYRVVYRQAMRLCGMSYERLAQHEEVFANLLGLVRGRVYYNLNNWYRMLLMLPSFRRNKADMEKMMGVTDPVDFVPDDDGASLTQRLVALPRLLRMLVGLVWLVSRADALTRAWLTRFDLIVDGIDRSRLRTLSFSALMERKRTIERDLLGHWSTPIVGDMQVMMATGAVRRLLARAGFDPSAAASLEGALIGGEEGIESTEPTRELMRIAALARKDDDAAHVLQTLRPEELTRVLSLRHPELHARVESYIRRYGDRVIGELKLESISLHEDPKFLFDVLRSYIARPDLDADKLAAQERAHRERAEAELLSRLSWWRHARAKKILRRARSAVRNRENMRLRRTRAFGIYRDIMRGIGARLFEAQKLDHPRDVFYLTVPEIEAYFEGRSVAADLAPLARARKAEFEAYDAADLPHRFETVGPVYHGNRYESSAPAATPPSGSLLRGIGCSAGVVESSARVILHASDELSVDGKVLVTMRTDPGWAPLFPTCSGVLVERGSTLSHSAVVARELGIPAVVGVPHLLERIRDGERIRLDGGRGTVELLERSS